MASCRGSTRSTLRVIGMALVAADIGHGGATPVGVTRGGTSGMHVVTIAADCHQLRRIVLVRLGVEGLLVAATFSATMPRRGFGGLALLLVASRGRGGTGRTRLSSIPGDLVRRDVVGDFQVAGNAIHPGVHIVAYLSERLPRPRAFRHCWRHLAPFLPSWQPVTGVVLDCRCNAASGRGRKQRSAARIPPIDRCRTTHAANWLVRMIRFPATVVLMLVTRKRLHQETRGLLSAPAGCTDHCDRIHCAGCSTLVLGFDEVILFGAVLGDLLPSVICLMASFSEFLSLYWRKSSCRKALSGLVDAWHLASFSSRAPWPRLHRPPHVRAPARTGRTTVIRSAKGGFHSGRRTPIMVGVNVNQHLLQQFPYQVHVDEYLRIPA